MLTRVVTVAALLVAAFLLYLILFGNGNGYRYDLIFQNGGQLVPRNQVMIGGHPVGSVDSLDLTENNLAKVSISIDQQLHEGTTAVIRASSLSSVANHYVSISPGPNSNPALESGDTIGLEDTTTQIALDQFFNTFTPRVREALSDFVRGNAGIYADRGKEANETYKYFAPALGQTRRWVEELNADQRQLQRFLTGSASLFSGLSARDDALASSVANANEALGSIATQNRALSRWLQLLPQTFRQANTTFVNLRAAFDDLDPLVATAKPATRDLAPFLADITPVLDRATPVFRDLRVSFRKKGKGNDIGDIVSVLPTVDKRASSAFPAAIKAIDDFQPTLDFARPYTPEMLNALAKLGQVTGYYDAIGHYVRASPVMNLFSYNDGTNELEAIPPGQGFDFFGGAENPQRCPGGTTQPASDGSSPYVAPPWGSSGLTTSDCDPGDAPPGP